MRISITLPDEIAALFRERWDDLPRRVLEVLAADAYRKGMLSSAQVQRMLGLPSRFDVASFLRTARSLNLEGPPDWSSRLEDYLYPEPPDQDE